MDGQLQASSEARALHLEPDGDLEVRLESALPDRLAVGAGNGIFVYGSCFHRHRRVRRLWLLADGRRIEPMAQRMPRRDLPAYRSAFWGIVTWRPIRSRETATLRVGVELDGGRAAVAELARLELEPIAPIAPVPWPEARSAADPVAICMATYNPAVELFRRQVESIRDQTHPQWLCVISDDNSDPERFGEIEEVIAGDPRFHVSRAPERLGFYRNFERALSLAPRESAYVALADQDDRWHPGKLETLASRLGDAQLVYSDARVVGVDGELISDTYWSHRRPNHSNLASLLVSNTITGASAIFRRELLDRVLPFPARFGTQWHDHWIALVALARGRVEYVDRPLYDYVQHRAAVIGHGVANPTRRRRGIRERARLLREDWRAALGGWCWKYFYGVCRVLLLAQVLELRCGGSLRGRKRRQLRRFGSIDRSPLGYPWLSLRRLRRLFGRNETLGGELVFLHGLAWRRLIALGSRGRSSPPRWLPKDAALPAAGGVDVPNEGAPGSEG